MTPVPSPIGCSITPVSPEDGLSIGLADSSVTFNGASQSYFSSKY